MVIFILYIPDIVDTLSSRKTTHEKRVFARRYNHIRRHCYSLDLIVRVYRNANWEVSRQVNVASIYANQLTQT